jgi:hypothetical protein
MRGRQAIGFVLIAGVVAGLVWLPRRDKGVLVTVLLFIAFAAIVRWLSRQSTELSGSGRDMEDIGTSVRDSTDHQRP